MRADLFLDWQQCWVIFSLAKPIHFITDGLSAAMLNAREFQVQVLVDA
jgi:hypothetical protein